MERRLDELPYPNLRLVQDVAAGVDTEAKVGRVGGVGWPPLQPPAACTQSGATGDAALPGLAPLAPAGAAAGQRAAPAVRQAVYLRRRAAQAAAAARVPRGCGAWASAGHRPGAGRAGRGAAAGADHQRHGQRGAAGGMPASRAPRGGRRQRRHRSRAHVRTGGWADPWDALLLLAMQPLSVAGLLGIACTVSPPPHPLLPQIRAQGGRRDVDPQACPNRCAAACLCCAGRRARPCGPTRRLPQSLPWVAAPCCQACGLNARSGFFP